MKIVEPQTQSLTEFVKPMTAQVSQVGADGMTDGNEVLVAFEGEGRFVDQAALPEDYERTCTELAAFVAEQAGFDPNRLLVDAVCVHGAPEIPWRVEGLWWGGDAGPFGDVVDAPDDVMATLYGYLSMVASDTDEPSAFVSTAQEISRTLTLMRRHHIHAPVPMAMKRERMEAIVRQVAEHADAPQDVRASARSTVAAIDGGPTGRFGPDAETGKFAVLFRSSRPGLEGVELWSCDEMQRYQEAVPDPASDTDAMTSFLEGHAKRIASRYFDYEAMDESDYLTQIDRFVDSLTIVDMGQTGPLQSFQIDAMWNDDEDDGPWSDDVYAVDHDDAVLKAAIAMAMSDPGVRDGREGFEVVAEAIEAHRIDVLPISTPTADLQGIVRALGRLSIEEQSPEIGALVAEIKEAERVYGVVLGQGFSPASVPTPW